MSEKVAVIIGVGAEQGMGAQLALRFGRRRLHVVVAGRTQEKLEKIAGRVRGEGGRATAIQADATNEGDTIALFEQAAKLGTIDLAIYNTGNNMPGPVEGMEAAYFERCWRVCCYGGFLFAREAVKHMKPEGRGTLLFTGASASMRGKANFAAFGSAKAALRSLTQSLARAHGPDGIHVGHVVIDGAIDGDQINSRVPELAAERRDQGQLLRLTSIVDIYEFLYDQEPGGWSQEVDVRTANEPF